jgi:DNA-binding PadR family transcriptional regulator
MRTNCFEMNEEGRHFGNREHFVAMFLGGRERGGRDWQGEEFDYRGREQSRPERGACGPEEGQGGCGHGFGRRGFRGSERGSERGFGGGAGGFGRGFGGGRVRMFDAGDVKLVVLKLLGEHPSYGYQLIKTMEERLAGGYTPSAGVIYPTLTLLEEEGLTAATLENNKKVYTVTDEGKAFLEANKRRVDELFARLEEAGKGFERGRSPEIMRAFMELREAVMARVARRNATPEQIAKITAAINAAAKAIDEL